MILSVLKVIGIILLIILILIIFILMLVLFVPVCYQFAGTYDKELLGEARVKWAPMLLKVEASISDNQPRYVVRLLGGVIMTNTGAKLSWIGRRFFSFVEEEEEMAECAAETLNGEESVQQKPFQSDEGLVSDATRETCEKKEMPKEKISLSQRICDRIKRMRRGWKRFLNKLKGIKNKKEDLLKVYHSKRFDMAKRDTKEYIKEFFDIIKPNRLEGYIHFGMEDPAITGHILGGLALVFPLYQEFLIIRPDFEEKCIEGNLKGKGKIFLFRILKLVLKVILNKNLIKVTKKVQTIIEA